MKKETKRHLKTFFPVLLLVLISASCVKNNPSPTQPTEQTYLSVIHAAPGYGGVDVTLNGEKLTTGGALNYGDGGNLTLTPDDYNITFLSPGSGTVIAGIQDSLRNQAFTSAILYGPGADTKVMLVNDDFAQSTNIGDAFLRFLQLSPGHDGVDVFIGQNDQIASDRSFADNITNPSLAKFATISSGSYSFTAVNSVGDTLGQLNNQLLDAGRAYTLFLDGIDGATDQADQVQLFLGPSY